MMVAIFAARPAPDLDPIEHTLIPVQRPQCVGTGLEVRGTRQATGSNAEGIPRPTGVC